MTDKQSTQRTADHNIEPLILNRRSPRAMSGEPITDEELFQLCEAARWAPSCFNAQPWKIFYAKRTDEHWNDYLELLVEFNQGWAHRAACLLVLVSDKEFPHNQKPSPTHSFDCGAAWQSLALQGCAMGLAVRGMAGFDYEQAQRLLDLPDNYHVEAMVAVGKPGKLDALDETLHKDEKSPSGRNSIDTFIFNGKYVDKSSIEKVKPS